jgi:ATP-dependent DNA helicase RecG
MIIENSERFGLSQLHQLRGRVGRGADQSYCILMSSFKLTHEAKERISTMTSTNDGFEIAEVDLRLRGPGSMAGTQQSGLPALKLANLVRDNVLLKTAREIALRILDKDPDLRAGHHILLRAYLEKYVEEAKDWSKIS